MEDTRTNLQKSLYLITCTVLLIGLGSAVLIYLTSENDSSSVLGYEDSKKYMHELELYGGKANVFVNEVERWFVGLWHGKSLAFTVAFITIFISLGPFLVAKYLSSHSKSEVPGENNQARDRLKNM